jgi:hypothetical protein
LERGFAWGLIGEMREGRRIEPLLISMMCQVARRRLGSVFWFWHGTVLYLNLNLIAK